MLALTLQQQQQLQQQREGFGSRVSVSCLDESRAGDQRVVMVAESEPSLTERTLAISK